NMLDAKSNLSRLVEQVESGQEKEIIIARNGKPAARLVPLEAARKPKRKLGLLAGRFPDFSLEEFDRASADITILFSGPQKPPRRRSSS
ncbi:MAG: type II toxin-antitoxin system Phd/YefM family antitoxin, partial [Beijerinckiaceae bacterium]